MVHRECNGCLAAQGTCVADQWGSPLVELWPHIQSIRTMQAHPALGAQSLRGTYVGAYIGLSPFPSTTANVDTLYLRLGLVTHATIGCR